MTFNLIKLNKNGNSEELLEFFINNSDYFQECENSLPNSKTVEEAFSEIPKGKSIEDKYLFGIYENKKLISYIELIKDRHVKHEWLLTIMIIDKSKRNKGIGKNIYFELEKRLIELGGKIIILGVVEKNTKAFNFWKKVGFKDTTFRQEDNNNKIIVMEKLLEI